MVMIQIMEVRSGNNLDNEMCGSNDLENENVWW